MEKRTKILLIVLVSLIVLAAGAFGIMRMMSGEETVAVAPAPAVNKAAANKPAPKPAEAAPAATATQPAQPGAPAPAAEQAKQAAQPPTAPPQQAKPGVEQAKPAAQPTAAQQQAAKPGETAKTAAAAPEAKPAVKPGEKPAPGGKAEAKAPATAGQPAKAAAAAPCTPVLKVEIKGKTTEFKTPEELVEKSGLDAKALADFSAKNMDSARKKLDALTKKRAPAGEIECAKKDMELADKLAKLVAAKAPMQPEKEVYTYSSLEKRDPFMPPNEIPKVYPKVPLNASPLEKVPSEQLSVDAIIWNQKGFRAMLVTPDNRGYTVKPGDTVGNKLGKVVKITERRVYIEERIPDIFGDVEVRSIVLKLHKEAE